MKTYLLLLAVLCSACSNMGLIQNYSTHLEKSKSPELIRHASYFKNKYDVTINDLDEHAYHAIVMAEILLVQFEIVLKVLEADNKVKKPIATLKSFKTVLIEQLNNYSNIWSNAISNRIRSGLYHIDFSSAIAVTKDEYTRIGVFNKIDFIKDKAKNRILKLNKNQYAKTYELYAIVNQLIDLTKDPSGSLISFNQNVNSLDSDFSKIYSLAELE